MIAQCRSISPEQNLCIKQSDIMGCAERIFGEAWKISPDLREIVSKRADAFAEDIRKLAGIDGTNARRRHAAIFHLLRSFKARFCCLILGWPKAELAISLEEAERIARRLDPRRNCGEAVRFWWKRKPGGGRRPLVSFGPRRRALQKLAVLILQAVWGPSKYDYAQRGRGRKAAMQKILSTTGKKGGPRWFLTADITNCFGSFNRDKLISLIPLPRSAIENCIFVMDDVDVLCDPIDKVTS